jgi:hypothetical protein
MLPGTGTHVSFCEHFLVFKEFLKLMTFYSNLLQLARYPAVLVFSLRLDIRQSNLVSDRIPDIKKGWNIQCIPTC